jgi:hypothetical protein
MGGLKMPFTQEIEDLIFGFDSSAGQVDNPVLVLLEKIQEYGHDAFEGKNKVGKPYYIMRMCKVFQLGIPTPSQIDAVVRAYHKVTAHYEKILERKYPLKPDLVIETTGMGLPNFQQFEQVLPNVYGIHPLGEGDKVSRDGKIWRVPKVDMGAELQVLVENGRMIIAGDIEDRKKIIQQLVNFTWKRKQTGTLTIENLKSSDHDDICDATMVAAWYGSYGIRRITFSSTMGLGI